MCPMLAELSESLALGGRHLVNLLPREHGEQCSDLVHNTHCDPLCAQRDIGQ